MADDQYVSVEDDIRREAEKQGVPADLALAVAEQESQFNPTLVNPTSGAVGTFQFLPSTAKSRGFDPTDQRLNITEGVKYLGELLGKHGGDSAAALKEYGGVKTDTTYVPGVLKRIAKFQDTQNKDTQEQTKVQPPVVPPAAEPSYLERFKRIVGQEVAPPMAVGQAAVGFAKKAGERLTAAGQALRERYPNVAARLDELVPPVTFSTTPQGTAQKIGAALEPAGEFAAASALTGGATAGAPLLLKAGAQAATGYGVTRAQGGTPKEGAVNAALGAVGPFVSEALPFVADRIKARAETQLALSLAQASEEAGPALTTAIKRGQSPSGHIQRVATQLRQAAGDILDAAPQLTWGKWMAATGNTARKAGQTLETALETPGLGRTQVPKQPVVDTLNTLLGMTEQVEKLPSGDYGPVTFDPRLAKELRAIRDELATGYGDEITVRGLHNIKKVWDKYVYTINKAGKVGLSADALADTAQKEGYLAGANTIREFFDEAAPTISGLDEAVARAKRVESLVYRLYGVQPGMGKMAQYLTRTAGAGAGVALGGLAGHPYMGLGFGSGLGHVIARAIESPAFQTLGPIAKDRLADALAKGQMRAALKILAPLLQSQVVQ